MVNQTIKGYLMSLAERIHFLQDMFQMTAIALVSVMNPSQINGLHLFSVTLYETSRRYMVWVWGKTKDQNMFNVQNWQQQKQQQLI